MTMTSLPVVTLWVTACLALMSVPMSISVGLRRAKTGILLLHGDDEDLLRRIRAHGNFVEYVPIAILALAAAEITGTARWLVVICGAVLIAARAIHYVGLRRAADGSARVAGAVMTSATIVVLAAATIWQLVAGL